MTIIFSPEASEDYLWFQENTPELLPRIHTLLKECQRTPFKGTGKPEPLKHLLKGWWSRRITAEHRLVYRPTENGLEILQLRYHY